MSIISNIFVAHLFISGFGNVYELAWVVASHSNGQRKLKGLVSSNAAKDLTLMLVAYKWYYYGQLLNVGDRLLFWLLLFKCWTLSGCHTKKKKKKKQKTASTGLYPFQYLEFLRFSCAIFLSFPIQSKVFIFASLLVQLLFLFAIFAVGLSSALIYDKNARAIQQFSFGWSIKCQ